MSEKSHLELVDSERQLFQRRHVTMASHLHQLLQTQLGHKKSAHNSCGRRCENGGLIEADRRVLPEHLPHMQPERRPEDPHHVAELVAEERRAVCPLLHEAGDLNRVSAF